MSEPVRESGISEMPSMTRRTVWILLTMVAVSASFRILWTVVVARDPSRLVEPDSFGYLESARALLWDFRFNQQPGGAEAQFVRTPGYPLVLALLMAIVGQSIVALAVLQAGLSALVVVPTYFLGRRIFGHAVGVIAGFFVGLEPQLLYYSAMVLTESLAAITLTVLCLTMVIAYTSPPDRRVPWLSVSAALAAATMVRPTTYYLPIVLTIALLVVGRKRQWGWRRIGINCLVLLLPVIVVTVGWQVRNQVRVESSRFSGIDAMSMYLYRGAGVIGEREGRSWLDVREELRADFGPRVQGEAQGPYYERMFAEGVAILASDPQSAAIITARGFLYNVIGDPRDPSRILGYVGLPDSPLLRLGARAAVISMWGLAAFGLYASRKRVDGLTGAMLLGCLIFYVLALSAGPESYSRFRAPVTPLILVLVAGGLSGLVSLARTRVFSGKVDA